jgi:hypothetical protein
MTRKAIQLDLLYQVGVLLAPVDKVVASPEDYSASERAKIRAQFSANADALFGRCLKFCRPEPDTDYAAEFADISSSLRRIRKLVEGRFTTAPAEVGPDIERERRLLQEAILAVPAETNSVVYEAGTPYTTHLRIRELCAGARKRLLFVDRYLTASIFHRYIDNPAPGLQVVLLTWPRASHQGKAIQRFDELLDVSRLYAQERPDHYRLLVNHAIHDRYVWADEQLFHVGGSLKDAGDRTAYTLTLMKNDAHVLSPVQDIFNTATELFGPTARTHP